jgi:hypothetical protein
MQHPQSCRRQLPRRERLRGVRATRASWRSSGLKYTRGSNQELIFRRMRPAGLPSGSVISSLVGDQLRHITGAAISKIEGSLI